MTDFNPGQVWRFTGREVDPEPQLIVIDSEMKDGISIIHVSVSGVKVKNPKIEGGYTDTIGHLAIQEDMLRHSVTQIEGTSQIPDLAFQGLELWRQGDHGGLDMSLAEALDLAEDIILNGDIAPMPPLPTYYCIEFDLENQQCMIKQTISECKGELRHCQFFNVYFMLKETCVLMSPGENEEDEYLVSIFFLGEGFEQRGQWDLAKESYERALEADPENEFLLEKLNKKQQIDF